MAIINYFSINFKIQYFALSTYKHVKYIIITKLFLFELLNMIIILLLPYLRKLILRDSFNKTNLLLSSILIAYYSLSIQLFILTLPFINPIISIKVISSIMISHLKLNLLSKFIKNFNSLNSILSIFKIFPSLDYNSTKAFLSYKSMHLTILPITFWFFVFWIHLTFPVR